MNKDEFDGITERENRLRRLQAGILPDDSKHSARHGASSKKSGSSSGKSGSSGSSGSSRAIRVSGAPPKRELSDKAAHLIAEALKSMMNS